jgi:hypothetical protein
MPVITPAHLHVLINHLPIIGIPLVALLLAWGLLRHQDAVIRAAMYGAVLMAVGTFAADQTGDGAKDNIEHESWAKKEVIHEHEESADYANIAGLLTGVAALVVLVMARGGKPVSRGGAFAILALLLFSAAIMARTGYLGGEIRHSEFQPGGTTGSAP